MSKPTKSKAVISFIRASTVKPKKVIWFWKGRIAIGTVVLLAGDPDQGKTQIAMYLASKASHGHLVGDLKGTPRDVVIVSAEDSLEHTLVPRLMAVNADLGRIHFVHVKRDQTTGVLDLLHDLTELKRVLAATKPALLIIDPLIAHISSEANSNQDQHVRLAMAPLGQIADELKLAVVALFHLNKMQDGKAIYRIGGSIGFVAAARSALLAAPDPRPGQTERFLLGHIKCNIAVKAPTLQYSIIPVKLNVKGEIIETSRIQLNPDIVREIKGADILALNLLPPEENEKASSKLEYAKNFLRYFLKIRRHPAKQLQILAKNFGFSAATLERAKDALDIVSNKMEFNAGWWWELPPPQPKVRGSVKKPVHSVPKPVQNNPIKTRPEVVLLVDKK